MYPARAVAVLHQIMHHKKFGRYPSLDENRIPTDGTAYDPRDFFKNRQAALAMSVLGHFHEIRGDAGNALVAYKEACNLDRKNGEYRDDFDRFRKALAEKNAEDQRRTLDFVRRTVPGVKIPAFASPAPLQQAGANIPSPPPAHVIETVFRAKTMQFETRGRQAMNAGRWFEAQMAFAQAYSCCLAQEKSRYRAYLRTAINKEIMRIDPLEPDADGRQREQIDDPRKKLPAELQGLI